MNFPKFILTTVFTFLLLIVSNTSNAQKFAKLDKSPMDAVSFPMDKKNTKKFIKVIYSRPQLRQRSLSTLTPKGKIWRTGANEAATITFYKDMKIAGKPIKAGTYGLFTIPGDTEWTIILSKDVNVWGAYSYKKINDVLRVKGKVSKKEESLEAFSITFDDTAAMYLGWGTLRVTVPISE